ncbi:MAG: molecular chaperone TorD family protein [Hyphomicrobium sp.]|nr:molecular chaperone TorD family protein [Hyphomicrobium sp.]
MSDTQIRVETDALPCEALLAAAGDDMALLAELHDREPTAQVLTALRAYPLEMALGLALVSPEAAAALRAMREAIAEMPDPIDAAMLDDLAAGFADVYLRFSFRVSPAESVWLTEEGLERQGPMFALREIYRKHNLKVVEPKGLPDDHLVIQLRFAARWLKSAKTREDAVEIADFLDQHLLRWIRRFAGRLTTAGASDFYVALALVTATYLDELREHLTTLTGVARKVVVEEPAAAPAARKKASVEDRPYVPGIAPSW